MRTARLIALALLAFTDGPSALAQAQSSALAKAVKVTVLSTMLAGDRGGGIGEWGFSALLEVDGTQLLIDTGERPETVLRNALELGIDLSSVTDVVITHNHDDHAGGLVTLRRELRKKNEKALSRAHVAKGILFSRPVAAAKEGNPFIEIAGAYEKVGGRIVEHTNAIQIFPNVWFTGPVPRRYPERNWSGTGQVRTPAGLVEDTIPEDASVVVNTQDGLVLVSGCGHAGIINTAEYARQVVRPAPMVAAIGGFHLFQAEDSQLTWTGGKLREFGLKHLIGAHCTGIEAAHQLRSLAGLTRQTAVVGAVGSSFQLGSGINPRLLAK